MQLLSRSSHSSITVSSAISPSSRTSARMPSVSRVYVAQSLRYSRIVTLALS